VQGKFTTVNLLVKRECAAEQLYIDNVCVSMSPTIRRYRTHQKSLCQHPCYCCQVPKFLQNLSFLLPRIFCLPYTIAIASSAWRTFALSLIDVFSFVLRCFRFYELVHVLILTWSMFTYNLIELHLIPTIGTQRRVRVIFL